MGNSTKRRRGSPRFTSFNVPETMQRRRAWGGWSGDAAFAFRCADYALHGDEPIPRPPMGDERVDFWDALHRSKALPKPNGITFTARPADRIAYVIHARTPSISRALRRVRSYVEADPFGSMYFVSWWRLPFEPTDPVFLLPADHPLRGLNACTLVGAYGVPMPLTGLAINAHRELAILDVQA